MATWAQGSTFTWNQLKATRYSYLASWEELITFSQWTGSAEEFLSLTYWTGATEELFSNMEIA